MSRGVNSSQQEGSCQAPWIRQKVDTCGALLRRVRLAVEIPVLRHKFARDEGRALRIREDRHPYPGGIERRDDHRAAELGGLRGGGIGVTNREDRAPVR